MPKVVIKGDVDKLRMIGKMLREAPDKEVKKELAKAVQRASKPVKEEIKQSARDTLPSSGGLNEWVADIAIKTTFRMSGRMPGVYIVGSKNNKRVVKKKSKTGRTFGANADLRSINRGRVFHPTFGHGPLVGPQSVRAGFWDRPFNGVIHQRAVREIRLAMAISFEQLAQKMNRAA
jgi:hypothetical protein